MSALIVDITSVSADTVPATWAVVDGLTAASITVSSASSVVLLTTTIPLDQSTIEDQVAKIRFAIDGVREGPVGMARKDNINKGCGVSLCYAAEGLSVGTHSFEVQWEQLGGRAGASTDTGRTRAFQVIEITDASILVDTSIVADVNAAPGFADITGLTGTATVSAGSNLIILSNVPPNVSGGDHNFASRVTIDAVHVGPELTTFIDATQNYCGHSQMWFESGFSGSTDFAQQWDEILGTVKAGGNFECTFQVIAVTANSTLHTNQTSVAVDALIGSYTDIVGLDATFTAEETGSVLLLSGAIQGSAEGDTTGSYRFYDGNTGEGPEQYIFCDDATGPDICGHSLYWATEAKSAGEITMSVRGVNVSGTVNLATDRERGLAILELTSGAAPVAPVGQLNLLGVGT